MAIKVPGSLGGLQFVQETTYGTTPTSTALSYMGFMVSMQESGNGNEEEIIGDGSRIMDTVIHKQRSAGFDATLSLFRDATGYAWEQVWPLAYRPSSDLLSFSALMKIDYDEYTLFKGCKIDTLVLSADGVGEKITGRLTVKAQKEMAHQASKAGFGTMGSENSGPTSKIPIIYDAYPTMTINGSSTQLWARSFTITVSNNLEEKEGIVSGEALAAGNGIVPGLCTVEVEYTLLSKNKDLDNLKLADTDGITIVQVIGGHTFTFSDCYVMTDDHPSRSQGSYDETIRFRAGSVTVV